MVIIYVIIKTNRMRARGLPRRRGARLRPGRAQDREGEGPGAEADRARPVAQPPRGPEGLRHRQPLRAGPDPHQRHRERPGSRDAWRHRADLAGGGGPGV